MASANAGLPVIPPVQIVLDIYFWAGPLHDPVGQWVGMARDLYDNLPAYDFVVGQKESGICEPSQYGNLFNGLPGDNRGAFTGVFIATRNGNVHHIVALPADLLAIVNAGPDYVVEISTLWSGSPPLTRHRLVLDSTLWFPVQTLQKRSLAAVMNSIIAFMIDLCPLPTPIPHGKTGYGYRPFFCNESLEGAARAIFKPFTGFFGKVVRWRLVTPSLDTYFGSLAQTGLGVAEAELENWEFEEVKCAIEIPGICNEFDTHQDGIVLRPVQII